MPYLISILVAGLLFFGFLLLTMYESRRGVRFFASARYKLDTKISRAGFLIEHIDWGAFTAHLTRTSLNTVAHDTAHATLLAVRSAERSLTRAVGALHRRRESTALPEGKSGPATFLSQQLDRPQTTRPMSDIVRKGEGE